MLSFYLSFILKFKTYEREYRQKFSLTMFQVFHKSEKNCSTNPRHAYTFHVIEMKGAEYSKVHSC